MIKSAEEKETDPDVRPSTDEKKEHESEFYGATKREDIMDTSN